MHFPSEELIIIYFVVSLVYCCLIGLILLHIQNFTILLMHLYIFTPVCSKKVMNMSLNHKCLHS